MIRHSLIGLTAAFLILGSACRDDNTGVDAGANTDTGAAGDTGGSDDTGLDSGLDSGTDDSGDDDSGSADTGGRVDPRGDSGNRETDAGNEDSGRDDVDLNVGCGAIADVRDATPGFVALGLCDVMVTYVMRTGFFVQSDASGPGLMVFEGFEWTPDVTVGDEISMIVTETIDFRGSLEVAAHGPIDTSTTGNDVSALATDLSSGTLPSESLEHQLVTVTAATVHDIMGVNLLLDYGDATDVSLVANDSGFVCEDESITLTAIVVDSDGAHFIQSYHLDQDLGSVSGCVVSTADPPAAGDLLINEVLADPPNDLAGDANCDEDRDGEDDEFIELVNLSDAAVNLAGVQIADSVVVRHTFPLGSELGTGEALVIFGGGAPNCDLDPTLQLVASTGSLSLNNGGDTVTITIPNSDDDDTLLTMSFTDDSGLGVDQSMTLSPDLNDTDDDDEIVAGFVNHSVADAADNSLYSAGTDISGSEEFPLTSE